jgi:BolA protein
LTVKDSLRAKLTENFSPSSLTIEDQSQRHTGHAGARSGGETHFRVVIIAEAFEGLSKIERQRAVYRVLQDELRGPVHALSLIVLAPSEAGNL